MRKILLLGITAAFLTCCKPAHDDVHLDKSAIKVFNDKIESIVTECGGYDGDPLDKAYSSPSDYWIPLECINIKEVDNSLSPVIDHFFSVREGRLVLKPEFAEYVLDTESDDSALRNYAISVQEFQDVVPSNLGFFSENYPNVSKLSENQRLIIYVHYLYLDRR